MARIDKGKTAREEQRQMGIEGKCSVCGEEPDAYWFGHQQIEICRTCAVTVLPALIADAVALPQNFNSQTYYDGQLDKVKANYWRAIASAVQANAREELARRDNIPTPDREELEEKLSSFMDYFQNVFSNDWDHTKSSIESGYYIDGTFLEPKVSDEDNNWANRGCLLSAYRDLVATMKRLNIPTERSPV